MKTGYSIINPRGHESRRMGFKQAAAYAAQVIKNELEQGEYPHVTVADVGHAVVETVGYKDSFRVLIADADIDDAIAGTTTRDEHRYILTACKNAIAAHTEAEKEKAT